MQVEHRILFILLPTSAVVQAEGEILGLPMAIRCIPIAGIDGNKALLGGLAKTARIVTIDHYAPSEDHHAIFFGDRNG